MSPLVFGLCFWSLAFGLWSLVFDCLGLGLGLGLGLCLCLESYEPS
jgi:hypothetical protein